MGETRATSTEAEGGTKRVKLIQEQTKCATFFTYILSPAFCGQVSKANTLQRQVSSVCDKCTRDGRW